MMMAPMLVTPFISALSDPAVAQASRNVPLYSPYAPLPPAPKKPSGKCPGVFGTVTYDPHKPALPKQGRFREIDKAICQVKPNGLVVIERDRDRISIPAFYVNKKGLTFRAADAWDGGTIVVEQGEGECVIIDPTLADRFEDVTTTLEGFTFFADDQGTKTPCIDVKGGTLILKNARVDMSTSAGVAIKVRPTGKLLFSATPPREGFDSEYGVFPEIPVAQADARKGTGVSADNARSIIIRNVTFKGLEKGVDSRAESNEILSARFENNHVGVAVKDKAVVRRYAPKLIVAASEFYGNETGVLVEAEPYRAAGQVDALWPYEGAIKFLVTSGERNTFGGNGHGIRYDGTFPQERLSVVGVDFFNQNSADITLPLPDRGDIEIVNSRFLSGAPAIRVTGNLDGQLTLAGDTEFSNTLDVPSGYGRIDAKLLRTNQITPLFRFDPNWVGWLSLDIEEAAPPEIIQFTGGNWCTAPISSKRDQGDFASRLTGFDVTLGGASYWRFFAGRDGELSRGEMRNAQKLMCRER